MITLKEIKRYPATNSVEATWVDGETTVKCHSYDQVQMDMLAADLGADLAECQHIIDEVNANFIPLPVRDPIIVKAETWTNIKAERDRRTQSGGYPAVGKWFHSDTFSRTQIISMFAMGVNLPAGIEWKTMDGTFVLLTPAIVGQVFTAAAAQDKATFECAESHRIAMEASPLPSAYDFSAGWPAIFGG